MSSDNGEWMNVSSDNRAAAFVMKGLSIWVLVGWVLFLYGFFMLPKQNALKIEFYLLLVLPSLLLIPHWIKHYKKYSSPLLTMSSNFYGIYGDYLFLERCSISRLGVFLL